MRLVLCALLDPLAQGGDLFGPEGLACLRRRHALLRILRLDALDQWAAVGLAWNDGRTEFLMRRVGEFRVIEAQSRLARAGTRAMAAVAVLRQDRLNRLVEGEPGRGPARAAAEQQRHHAQRREQQRSGGASDPRIHPCTLPPSRARTKKQGATWRPAGTLGNSSLTALALYCRQSWSCGGCDASCASSASRSKHQRRARPLRAGACLPRPPPP